MELEHLDVLIVGAGLSGIGAAHHLGEKCPAKTYAILEARDAIGGTWDLFRYPGVRSDSDMYTLGYSFRPWDDGSAIAPAASILSYVRDTADEGGITGRVRFGHRVVRAAWSTPDARWTVDVEVGGPGGGGGAELDGGRGELVRLTCGFLLTCTGYYRYDDGYTPEFPGSERFAGVVAHPQHWTEDIDYAGKRVVVIGSGATAVTLVPAMAASAGHVTMLQRSPSYVVSLPAKDPIADVLRRVAPAKVAYTLVRWKNVLVTMTSFELSRRRPAVMKAILRRWTKRQLPRGFAVDTHFKPSYNPWDQRLCVVPDGDLFRAIRSGRASVATGRIDTFTETGVRLRSGEDLPADLIVTATGLDLLAIGGMTLAVDGREIHLSETMSYKGMMLAGVPNLAVVLGYTNASWTLKVDLTCDYVCRLLNHMDDHGYIQCMPGQPDPSVGRLPFIDFSSGYIRRAAGRFPMQGSKAPWRLYQNYFRDILSLRYGRVEDGALEFSGRG
ncbi:MAG TPA: NAD(P)/FAD-dependent oxidoreductase [Solirubrobacteraceae bacterium]